MSHGEILFFRSRVAPARLARLQSSRSIGAATRTKQNEFGPADLDGSIVAGIRQ